MNLKEKQYTSSMYTVKMFSPYIIVRILFGLSLCVNNVHNSRPIVQYNTGTIISSEEVVSIGMVHVNMLIRIPPLPSCNNVQYPRPCDTVHEFTSDLLRTNITASTASIENSHTFVKTLHD